MFGQWTVDPFGLPAYRYTMDEEADPLARQPNLSGSTDAWSQVGNTRVKADAFNHGYTQLWSQDRLAQWTNYYDAAHGHFSGGFGYVNVDGKVFSTLYDDRPPAADGVPQVRRRILRPCCGGRRRRSERCRCSLRSATTRCSCTRSRSRTLHPNRTPVVVRVLGRQPVCARRQGVPGIRRPDLVGPHPDLQTTQDPTDGDTRSHVDLRRGQVGGQYQRVHHDPGLVLRYGRPISASGRRRRSTVQPRGPARFPTAAREPPSSHCRAPRYSAPVGRSRSGTCTAMRIPSADRGPGGQVPRALPIRSPPVSTPGRRRFRSCRWRAYPGSGASSSGTATSCARQRWTKRSAASIRSPRATTTSTNWGETSAREVGSTICYR